MATSKQLEYLRQLGYQGNVATLSTLAASQLIDKLKPTATWHAYIDAIPWTPGQLDHQEYCAFSKAAYHGIDPAYAYREVLQKMQRSGARQLRLSKIRHSRDRAYASGGDGPCRNAPPLQLPVIKPYDEGLLRETVGELGGQVDETFFLERSPYETWNRSPAGVLHKLSRPGEHIWVTADSRSPDGCLWTHEDLGHCRSEWISVSGQPGGPETFGPNFSCLSWLVRGQNNVWFLPNPVSGEAIAHERFAYGHSYRCLEAVACWRYLVLETDVAPGPLWLGLLAMLPLRIAAVYHSGGRGYHALAHIEAASKLEADEICESYRREYTPLGACPGTLSPFRLSRLPNCHRGQSGQWQRLIYLSSNPTGRPIIDQPVLRKVPHQDEDGAGT